LEATRPSDTSADDGTAEIGAELAAVVRRLRVEHDDAVEFVNLVPSETRLSPLAQAAMSTDFVNRYFFNDKYDPGFWQFRGAERVAELETHLARPSLSRLADAPFVNLRPVSGMSAMTLVLLALSRPGDSVVSLNKLAGGHFATASLIQRLGRQSCVVDAHEGHVDVRSLCTLLCNENVALVYVDLQNSLHALQVEEIAAEIARTAPNVLLHVDCSHTMGLILGGLLPNPLDLGADSMGGSTHKSFPGPHKGMAFTRDQDIRDRLVEAQFDLISSHHLASTIALGIAAREFEHFGPSYAREVVSNANTLGNGLRRAGFDVVAASDLVITETHQVWVRIGNDATTNELSSVLAAAGMRVNIQTDLPGLPGPILRLGVNEMTFEGAGESSMNLIVKAFQAARSGDVRRAEQLRVLTRESYGAPYYFGERQR
jgi:glycine hydroxymethyltransferase